MAGQSWRLEMQSLLSRDSNTVAWADSEANYKTKPRARREVNWRWVQAEWMC